MYIQLAIVFKDDSTESAFATKEVCPLLQVRKDVFTVLRLAAKKHDKEIASWSLRVVDFDEKSQVLVSAKSHEDGYAMQLSFIDCTKEQEVKAFCDWYDLPHNTTH